MTYQRVEDPELEEDRQRRIQELLLLHGPDWLDQYAPGTFGCHELMDRTSLLLNNLRASVLEHPACVANEEWYALADEAGAALWELYQRVASVQMPAPDRT